MLKDPAQAQKLLNSGAFPDIDGVQANLAIKQTDSLMKQSRNEDRAAQNFAQEQQDKADMSTFFRDGGQLDPATGRFVPKPGYVMDMLKGVGKPGGVSARTAAQAIAYSSKPDDAVSGAGVLHSTLTGLMDGTMTSKDVISKIGEPGGLSKADASFAMSLTNNMDGGDKLLVQSTLKGFEANLNPKSQFGIPQDPMNTVSVTKATAFMQDALDKGHKAGLTNTQILDPNSPTYFMKGMTWDDPKFKVTLADQVQGARLDPASVAGARAASPDSAPGSFADRIQNLGERSGVNAVSPKGAEGSMQVMPGTQSDPGFGVRPSNGTPEDTRREGVDYANAMKKEFLGNETLAAAAYNAGPAQVHKWMVQFGDPNEDEISNSAFAAAIPIPETRAYVGRVTGGGPPASSPERAAEIMWGNSK
jgi:hypothetical protein